MYYVYISSVCIPPLYEVDPLGYLTHDTPRTGIYPCCEAATKTFFRLFAAHLSLSNAQLPVVAEFATNSPTEIMCKRKQVAIELIDFSFTAAKTMKE